ncbi:hypothetical protein V4890_17190 [Ralstonia solanacearum species complex bacterium KE056]|uniref:hypothetical protein n=1 Tax=Ralstonia solanacearum species complex bacterium KE056 TaxID=3119585 RepID=UPI002FC2B95F
MWYSISSSSDIEEFMKNANWFHDGALKDARFSFSNWVDEFGSFVMESKKKSSACLLFQFFDSKRGRIEFEMRFFGIVLANLVGEIDGYDGLITSANVGFKDGRIFWAAHGEWSGDVSDRNIPWIIAEIAEWRLMDNET